MNRSYVNRRVEIRERVEVIISKKYQGIRTVAIVIFVALTVILSIPVLSAAAPSNIDYSGEVSDVTYTWKYLGNNQKITVSIPDNAVASYGNTLVPRFGSLYKVHRFTTPDDPIIQAVAVELYNKSHRTSMYRVAEYVLQFVQSCIEYKSDGMLDYWQYPVETLAKGTGDCEDMSFLFASLMTALGFNAVYISSLGHLQVGLDLDGFGERTVIHDDVEYSLCETTAVQRIGYDSGQSIIEIVDPNSHSIMLIHIFVLVFLMACLASVILETSPHGKLSKINEYRIGVTGD